MRRAATDAVLTPRAAASLRGAAATIFKAAIRAVDPAQLVADFLARSATEFALLDQRSGRRRTPTLVIGAGKAAARMAAGCEAALGANGVHGEVIVADGCAVPLRSVVVTEAGHPLPDGRGEAATSRLINCLRAQTAGLTLCLLSGGASSLLVSPRAPVTLRDKIETTRLLLECGADIAEFNTVRKHLSTVKGGGLLRHARTRMLALIISDVVGDDPGTIGSGPTAPDESTFADARGVLERYRLAPRVPRAVSELLENGLRGRVPETVKLQSREAQRCRNFIVGSNRTALEGAAAAARSAGWSVHIEPEPLVGDTRTAAQHFGRKLLELLATGEGPLCVLAGGETTVEVKGPGRGGRNQEFALVLASVLAGEPITVLSAGTDGIDGPTPAAGAFVDGTTQQRAQLKGLTAAAVLRANDSYTFFDHLEDLFSCGPTGTNAMDVKIALLPRRRHS